MAVAARRAVTAAGRPVGPGRIVVVVTCYVLAYSLGDWSLFVSWVCDYFQKQVRYALKQKTLAACVSYLPGLPNVLLVSYNLVVFTTWTSED